MDPATASNYAEVSVPDFSVRLAVDFPARRVYGLAQLSLAAPGKGIPATVTLDAHKLGVFSVTGWRGTVGEEEPTSSGIVLPFETVPFTAFGGQLRVDTTALSRAEAATLRIAYAGGEGAALCWLDPVQTAGKAHPFLFTQGQACLNRTLFPCQDTPSSRSTWRATLIVPRTFTAVMSAPTTSAVAGSGGVGDALSEGSFIVEKLRELAALPVLVEAGVKPVEAVAVHAFSASMPHAVPVYLVAFAVGDLRCAGEQPLSRGAQASARTPAPSPAQTLGLGRACGRSRRSSRARHGSLGTRT